MSERVQMNVVCRDEYDRNLLITAAIDDVLLYGTESNIIDLIL